MKSNASSAVAADYFEMPVCSDEGADLAYQAYSSQRTGTGPDFPHLLEEHAWLQTSRPVVAEPAI